MTDVLLGSVGTNRYLSSNKSFQEPADGKSMLYGWGSHPSFQNVVPAISGNKDKSRILALVRFAVLIS